MTGRGYYGYDDAFTLTQAGVRLTEDNVPEKVNPDEDWAGFDEVYTLVRASGTTGGPEPFTVSWEFRRQDAVVADRVRMNRIAATSIC